MERRKSELLTDVLQRWLREEGLETPLAQHRVIQCWADVVGPDVAAVTTSLNVRNQTLYASVNSPILRNELMLQRSALAYALNQHVGTQVIADVKITG